MMNSSETFTFLFLRVLYVYFNEKISVFLVILFLVKYIDKQINKIVPIIKF